MSMKLSIKPVNLAFIGLAIIALGVLIPSFFISPFSTIGLSIIIGSVILLSAYAFFAVNLIKSKGAKTIKWVTLPVVLAMLVGGAFFGNYKYQQSLNDKIYAMNDTVKMSDFSFTVSSPSYITPPLNVPDAKVAAFGNVSTPENCSSSKYTDDFDGSVFAPDKANAMYRDYCNWRNDSRKKIQEYIANYKRVNINYKIVAENTVTSKDVEIAIMPDSGRDVKKSVDKFDYDPLLSEKYTAAFDYSYQPYSTSQIGGDINKGITRSQNVSFDVSNSEKTIDLKVSYEGESRLVRIAR